MLADFVEMSASAIASAGAGDVTMAQIAGAQMGGSYTSGARPKFSTVFGTTARAVKYVIEDITTGAYERGIGYVNASGTDILTRAVVRETWTGSGLVRVGATPLAFTASAQNVRVRIAPQSDDSTPAIPQIASVWGTSSGLISGHYCHWNVSQTNTPTSAWETYMPYLWQGTAEIDQIGVKVTTAVASAGVKLGIYTMRPDGMPGVCVAHTNNNPLSCAATGFVSASMAASSPGANVRLAPGWYWIGYVASSNSIAFASPHPYYQLQSPAGFVSGVQNTAIYRNSGSYATGLPADASGGNSFNIGPPSSYEFFVYLRPKVGA